MADLSDPALRGMVNTIINGLMRCDAGDFSIPMKVINYLGQEIIAALRTVREAQRERDAEIAEGYGKIKTYHTPSGMEMDLPHTSIAAAIRHQPDAS